MAFGLLSVLLPLYITNDLGGSLIDVGIMAALANFVAIPFSFLWGYLSDVMRRYRPFILLSFSAISALLFLFSSIRIISVLIILYAAIAAFHVAHEVPKNVLISEHYPRSEWERGFASYSVLTDLGWLSGLLLGFALSSYGFSSAPLILLCGLLHVIAFLASFFLVKDPLLVFERRLMAIERAVDFVHRGLYLALRALNGMEIKGKLRGESAPIFCCGLLLFSLSTNMLFTPLPIFFSKNLSLPTNVIFGLFALNTLGCVLGYALAGRMRRSDARIAMVRASIARAALPFLLIATEVWLSTILAAIALMIMGVAYGLFTIAALSLSMELIPEGKVGALNAIIGLGGALGCFVGTYMAENFGFWALFATASSGFLLSYMAFKVF